MSITDELREWIERYTMSGERYRELLAIVNRIDERHEQMQYDYQHEFDGWNFIRDTQWVELPVDADGEIIHMGDVMETDNGIREVDVLQKSSRKWSVGLVPVGGGAFSWHDAETLRHHREPTVEDVLREFTDAILEWAGKSGSVAEVGTWSDVAAEYASKLRLAGEA